MKTRPILAFSIAALLAPAVHAQTITVFNNRAAFEGAISGSFYVDDFSLAPPLLGVTTTAGSVSGAKWFDIVSNPAAPSTIWDTSFGSTAWGGNWDPTPAGVGSGVAFEVDFGGGNIVTVPGTVAGNSPANVFFGFTASSPFLSVRVKAAGATQETHTLDDMTFQGPVGAFGTFNFIQAGAGAWDTGAHWDAAAAPGQLARVIIAPTGGTVASGPAVATTVQSLTLGSATSASRLDLQDGATLTATSIANVQTGGTLAGAGRLLGPVAMAAGSTLTVADGQTLQVGKATAGGFTTAGTITIGTGTLILEDTGATPLGTLTTIAGGTLSVLGGTAQIGSGDTLRGHGSAAGAFELMAGGTLRAENGTLQMGEIFAIGGTAIVDAARTLSFTSTGISGFGGGSILTVGAGATISSAGRLQVAGSSTLGAGVTASGATGLDLGGTLSHAGAQVFDAGTGDLLVFDMNFTPDATDTLSGARLVMSGNSALLFFNDEAVLGTAGNQIVLDAGGALLPTSSLALPASRAVEITATGGKLLALAGVDFTVNGGVAGAGVVTIAGGSGGFIGGTVRLTGTNTNTGGIVVEGATLEAGSAALGGASGVLNLGRTSGFNTFPAVLRVLGNVSVAATRSTTFASATVDTNGFDVTFNQPITGLNLTKDGAGVLRLNTKNANDNLHSVFINAGTLRIGANNALGLGARVTTTAGTVLDLNGFNHELVNVNGDGDIALGAGTLTTRGGSTIGGVISGAGGVVMKFDATRLLGENTFTGGLTVRDGAGVSVKTTAGFGGAGNAVVLDNGGIFADSEAPAPVVIGAAFPMTIAAGGARFGASGQPLIIEALLAGANPLRVQGGGPGYEVRFANATNTFTGNIQLGDSGSDGFGSAVLGIVADGSLGNAANIVTLGDSFFDGESTRVAQGTLRAFANLTLPATRVIRLNGSTNGSDDMGGEMDTNGFDVTIAGGITQLSPGMPLLKTGAGTLTLEGANTHTGETEVADGTLVVSGSLSGGTRVHSTGILSGTGTVGNVDLSFGGTLAPGSSPGTLHTGDVTFGGGTFALEFASPALGDQLDVTGSVTLNGDTELSLTLGYTPAGADTFIVMKNDGSDASERFGDTTFFTFGGEQLSEGEFFTAAGAGWTISYAGGTGNDVTLTVVPEPASAALLLGWRRRRE